MKYENKKIYDLLLVAMIMVAIFCIHLVYLLRSMSNVPIMDYWRYIGNVTEKIFTGKFSYQDCFESYAGHKNSINIFLLFLNMKLFGYNTMIEIIGGAIIRFILFIICVIQLRKALTNRGNVLCSTAFIGIILFNLNQWEIITIEFSLAFAIRVLFFFLIFIYVDKKILKERKVSYDIILFSVGFLIVVINIAGAYFAAMIVAFGSTIILKLLLTPDKHEKRSLFVLGIVLLLVSIIACGMYYYGMEGIIGTNTTIDFLKVAKGAAVMLASGVLHTNIMAEMNINLVIACGVLIFCGYIGVMVLYVRNKCTNITCFPIMLILYSLVSCLIISYGRASEFSLEYMESSRYVVEITFANIGIVMAVAIYYEKCKPNIFLVLFTISLVGLVLVSNLKEYKIGAYRKSYVEEIARIMLDINEYEDEQLNCFQANSPEQVREGVKLLEKYKLGIFSE